MNYTQRTNATLSRAMADISDRRKAKRFLNRVNGAIRANNGKHGSYISTHRNQTRRVLLRMIARSAS